MDFTWSDKELTIKDKPDFIMQVWLTDNTITCTVQMEQWARQNVMTGKMPGGANLETIKYNLLLALKDFMVDFWQNPDDHKVRNLTLDL